VSRNDCAQNCSSENLQPASRAEVAYGSRAALAAKQRRGRLTPDSRLADGRAGSSGSGQKLTHAAQQTASLFDHLVGANQDRLRHRKAERLGGLEVQDHLELGRKLHREIARLLAA